MKKKPTLEEMVTLRKQGWSSDRIARLYGMPYRVVDELVKHTCRKVDTKLATAETANGEVFRLRAGGMTMKEIAEKVGVSIGKVWQILHWEKPSS